MDNKLIYLFGLNLFDGKLRLDSEILPYETPLRLFGFLPGNNCLKMKAKELHSFETPKEVELEVMYRDGDDKVTMQMPDGKSKEIPLWTHEYGYTGKLDFPMTPDVKLLDIDTDIENEIATAFNLELIGSVLDPTELRETRERKEKEEAEAKNGSASTSGNPFQSLIDKMTGMLPPGMGGGPDPNAPKGI